MLGNERVLGSDLGNNAELVQGAVPGRVLARAFPDSSCSWPALGTLAHSHTLSHPKVQTLLSPLWFWED